MEKGGLYKEIGRIDYLSCLILCGYPSTSSHITLFSIEKCGFCCGFMLQRQQRNYSVFVLLDKNDDIFQIFTQAI